MNPEISVIIPIHNAKGYLNDTIEYLKQQIFTDFEVVFVDDASEDGTTELLKGAIKNSGLSARVIELESNSGCGAARNIGIKASTGKYVMCLDADDYYYPQLLQQLYTAITVHGADVAVCCSIVHDHAEDTKRIFGQWRRINALKELKNNIFVCDNPIHFNGICDLIDYVAWSKMIRKDYLVENDLWFPHLEYYEDIAYSFNSVLQSKRTIFVAEPLIEYNRHSTGGMTSWIKPKEHYMVDAFNLVLTRLEECGCANVYIEMLNRALNNLEAQYSSGDTLLEDKELILKKICQRAYREWHIEEYETSGDIKVNTVGLFATAKELLGKDCTSLPPLLYGDKVILCAMSDPIRNTSALTVAWELKKYLEDSGLNATCLDDFEFNDSRNILGKADYLNKAFDDHDVKYIFDISGGDLANEILEYLDYDVISNSNAIYVGYSDLTVITNAIFAITGKKSLLYRINNLILDKSGTQQERFKDSFLCGGKEILSFKPFFYRGDKMEGVVIGGNIRCFLKLSGTDFLPDITDKLLFLESLNDNPDNIRACIAQLKQQGVFSKIKGLIIGTFGKKENENAVAIDKFILSQTPEDLPVVKTREVGHGYLSKAIVIGGYLKLDSDGECKWSI